MARFVSPHPKYSLQVQPEKTKLTADGYPYIVQHALFADFQQGGLRPAEIQVAMGHFSFGALPETVTGETRLSVFDSEQQGWDPETRERLENIMRNYAMHGHDYLEVVKAKLTAPWPNYDKVGSRGQKPVAAVIADTVRDDGYDPEYVLAYEQENLNRPDVIEALRNVQVSEDEEVLA